MTPNEDLLNAALTGNANDAQVALAAGADANAKDASDWTALHRAAAYHRISVARLLIDAGAEVDAKNSEGRTPLHFAALRGFAELSLLLIASGADRTAKDFGDYTPLQLAQQHGRKGVVELLIGPDEKPEAGSHSRKERSADKDAPERKQASGTTASDQ